MSTDMEVDNAKVDEVDALTKQVQELHPAPGSPPVDPDNPMNRPCSPFTVSEAALVQDAEHAVAGADKGSGPEEFSLVEYESDVDDSVGPTTANSELAPGADTALPDLLSTIMTVTAVPADVSKADSSAPRTVTITATHPPAERISTATGNHLQPAALSAQGSATAATTSQTPSSTTSVSQNADVGNARKQALKVLVEQWTEYDEVDSMTDRSLAKLVGLYSTIRVRADDTTLTLTTAEAAAFVRSLRKARIPRCMDPPPQHELAQGSDGRHLHRLRKAAVEAHKANKGPVLPEHLHDLALPGDNGSTTPHEYTIEHMSGTLLQWMFESKSMRTGPRKQIKFVTAAVNTTRYDLPEHEQADWLANGLGMLSGDTVVAPTANDPQASIWGYKWTRGFAAIMAAMSQAVHSEKASPGRLGLSDIIGGDHT